MIPYCEYWEKNLDDVNEHEMLDVCNEEQGWDCQTCPYFGELKNSSDN